VAEFTVNLPCTIIMTL